MYTPQIPESGSYTFYAACDDECEVWIDNADTNLGVDTRDLPERTEESSKTRLIQLKQGQWTNHNQWDKWVLVI